MKAREAKIPPPGKPRFTEAAEREFRHPQTLVSRKRWVSESIGFT